MSGGTVSYEGRFDIFCLSGSFLLSEDNGSCHRTGGLGVSLAGSDGIVLGGVLNPNASRLIISGMKTLHPHVYQQNSAIHHMIQ